MGNYRSLPPIQSTQGLLTASIVAPVAALSYFPHQEPRFLIPVTLPIVLLYSNIITRKTYIYKMWIFLNIVCLIFYGFIHQAGHYSATVRMSKEIQQTRYTVKSTYLITSHIYSLPLSLMQQPNTQRIYGSGSSKHMKIRKLFLQELGSSSLSAITKHLSILINKPSDSKHKPNIYLLIPTSKFYDISKMIIGNNLSITEINTFYPHISTEALPDFHHSLTQFYFDYSFFNFIADLLSSCGLGLYQIRKVS